VAFIQINSMIQKKKSSTIIIIMNLLLITQLIKKMFKLIFTYLIHLTRIIITHMIKLINSKKKQKMNKTIIEHKAWIIIKILRRILIKSKIFIKGQQISIKLEKVILDKGKVYLLTRKIIFLVYSNKLNSKNQMIN